MQAATQPTIKPFAFPHRFEIPNLRPFCCKMETWLRTGHVPLRARFFPELAPTRQAAAAPLQVQANA